MTPDFTNARWFKSSASSVTGCVEVAHLPNGLVALRDSKDVSKARTCSTAPSGRPSDSRTANSTGGRAAGVA